MGQENLAALTHLSLSAIQKYEQNLRVPKDAHIEKIAIALHISPEVLTDHTSQKLSDALPALFQIGKWGGIQFSGKKTSDGAYDPDTVCIRFQKPELKDFLKEWATRQEMIDKIRQSLETVEDEKLRHISVLFRSTEKV